jgi:hypothetical protein
VAKQKPRQFVTLVVSLFLVFYAAPLEVASGAPLATLTVAVRSSFLRRAPDFRAQAVFSVFEGQTYTLTGRTADDIWVRLDCPGAPAEAWLPASYGTVTGDLKSVPIVALGQPAIAPVTPAATAAVSSATDLTGTVPITISIPVADLSRSVARFTLQVKSTFGRRAASLGAPAVASLFKGQSFGAVGQSLDKQWVLIVFDGGPAWVPAAQGRVSGGVLPIVSDAANPIGAPVPTPAPLGDILPKLTPHMREVYAGSAARGLDPNMFTAIGDCNMDNIIKRGLKGPGQIDLSATPELAAIRQGFDWSFERAHPALRPGLLTPSVFDATWANPRLCLPGETPLDCDLRDSRASLLFVGFSAGDVPFWQDAERQNRRIIETALQRGVLPILITKADPVEEDHGAPENYINNLKRRLAAEYDVPLIDFWLASRALPNNGLVAKDEQRDHLTPEAIDVELRLMLQTLYALAQ